VPFDLVAQRLQQVARLVARLTGITRRAAVHHEDRRVRLSWRALAAAACGQRHVARQAQHAGQFFRMAQAGLQVIAQPCEKPARTMRSAGMPRAFSRAISASTSCCEARRPFRLRGACQVGAE
jgi:hypothetical protein